MKIELANLKPAEETFLRGVIEKFTDPKEKPVADYLMEGRLVIRVNPGGKPMFIPQPAPLPSPPATRHSPLATHVPHYHRD